MAEQKGIIGINFNFRNPGTENGDQSPDSWVGRRPWVWSDSVSNSASLLEAPNPWNPTMLNDMKNFAVIRTMEWVSCNSHPISKWSNRRQKTDWPQESNAWEHYRGATNSSYIQGAAIEDTMRKEPRGVATAWGGGLGVAWEWIIDLANRTDKTLWINVPHRANDDYVDHLATLLRETVTNNKNIYIEYSNEIWNSGNNFFGQYEWCLQYGRDKSLPGLPNPGKSIGEWLEKENPGSKNEENRSREGYYAWRSAQIWKRMKDVFDQKGKGAQLRFVLAGPLDDGSRLTDWKTVLSSRAYNPGGLWPSVVCKGIYVGWSIDGSLADNSDEFWTALNNDLNDTFRPDFERILENARWKNVPYCKQKVRDLFSATIPVGSYEVGIELPHAALGSWRDQRMFEFMRKLVRQSGEELCVANLYCYSGSYRPAGVKISAFKESVTQNTSGQNNPMWRGIQQGMMDLANAVKLESKP